MCHHYRWCTFACHMLSSYKLQIPALTQKLLLEADHCEQSFQDNVWWTCWQ